MIAFIHSDCQNLSNLFRWQIASFEGQSATFGLAVASLAALEELALSCCCDLIVASFLNKLVLNKLGPLLPKLQKLMISAEPQFEFQSTLRSAIQLDTLYFDLHRNPEFANWWASTEHLVDTIVQLVARHPSSVHSRLAFEHCVWERRRHSHYQLDRAQQPDA